MILFYVLYDFLQFYFSPFEKHALNSQVENNKIIAFKLSHC
jgi:hypothetical protein